jgi:transcriptional regulator with XRE-family HTH domain
MTTSGSPAVRRRRLAAELRTIREDTGKSGDSVAAALNWSPSKISRYELAMTGLKIAEVEKLLNYYQVTGERREQLLDLARDAARKGWWEAYSDGLSEDYQQFIGLEHEARSIAIWHVEVVTGLLQTEAYARHIISSYGQVEPIAPRMVDRLVSVRMQRQQVLEREPPVQLSVVFDESVLRRAGIEDADCFASVTNGDNRNIMAAQIAKEIFKVPRVITRIYDPIREETYREFGLETICSTRIVSRMIGEFLNTGRNPGHDGPPPGTGAS